MYKVSVIIPVYNAQSTIQATINSVINQTMQFENIELIIIDDKSTDNSREIIEEFSRKYNNIKFIKLDTNSGLPSKPRNMGIENSTAPYLMFLDNDDLLTPTSCETLFNTAEKYNSQIVCCESYTKFINGFYAPINNDPIKIKKVKNKSDLRMTCWGYIFKTDFLREFNIKFPLYVPEDGIFIVEALSNASNIIYVKNFYGYAYTVESNDDLSYIHDINNEKFLSYLNGHYSFLDKIRKYNLNEKIILTNSISILILMFIKVTGSHESKISTLKELHKFENHMNFNVILPSIPLNILNKLILKNHYQIAILFFSLSRIVYKNNKIKNLIFKKYSNLEKIEM